MQEEDAAERQHMDASYHVLVSCFLVTLTVLFEAQSCSAAKLARHE